MKSRSSKIFGIFCILCISGALFIYRPWKVTDPADPRFDPEHFSYWDYPMGGGAKREVFAKMFPVGTPKKFVDHVLIDVAGGSSWKIGAKVNYYGYWEPHRIVHWKGPPSHQFLFDENENLLQVTPGGGSKLYPEQPDYREYWNKVKNKENK